MGAKGDTWVWDLFRMVDATRPAANAGGVLGVQSRLVWTLNFVGV